VHRQPYCWTVEVVVIQVACLHFSKKCLRLKLSFVPF
jgi:hypothetical protein